MIEVRKLAAEAICGICLRTEALSVTYFKGATGSSVSAACRSVSKTEERSRKRRVVLIGGFFIVFVRPVNAETIIGLGAKKKILRGIRARIDREQSVSREASSKTRFYSANTADVGISLS